jgi:hypothetical protein
MMMAYGSLEWYQIQNTRDHTNARYRNVPDFSIVEELDGRAVLISDQRSLGKQNPQID